MTPEQVQQLISSRMPDARVSVTGGDGKFEATVISAEFEGLNPVKRHQRVYATVGGEIASGAIHALSIKPFTPAQWEASNG
ncbi:BolA family protein [Thioalkalivibrio sulfidiphilus]|uniref:BolA family protein n=1 Tax=Thioalkalivibrio sulfidiphilus TaxID=1033854 RepID=UPI00037F30E9|nr:BolA/IbaG family iron-sulfur metabolism protein [Thioalkalivibrio sulfidiphilus]